MIESETDWARPIDLKMQVIVNKDRKSIEKSIPNLDRTRDRQI